METYRLYVELKPDADMALAMFPLREGQYLAEEYEAEDGRDSIFIDIDLGDYTDTTAAQEQYLNTNPAVISYGIR